MPVEPVSLNQITSVRGDPDLSYGSQGGTNVVIPFGQGIEFLSRAAQLKAESDRYKYSIFQQNLQDFYKNFNEINVDGIMEADYPIINEKFATLTKDLAEYYDVVRNPSKDPEKYAELKQREADLRGNISRSKQDVAWRTAHDTFIRANPSYNTPQYQQESTAFNTTELGARKYNPLVAPYVFDPAADAKYANEVAKQTIKQDVIGDPWITTTDKTTYLDDAFAKAWAAKGAELDETGRPRNEGRLATYKRIGLLTDDINLTDPAKKAEFDRVDREYGLTLRNQTQTEETMRENTVAEAERQRKFQEQQNALQRAATRANLLLKGDEKEIAAAGRDYNESLTSAYTTGKFRADIGQSVYGDSSEIEVTEKEMVDNPLGAQFPKVPSGKEVKTKKPRVVFVDSDLDASGNLIVKRWNNETKQMEADLVVPFDKGREDFKSLGGAKNSGRVADAGAKWRRDKKFKEGTPDVNEMNNKFFKFGDQQGRDWDTLTQAQWFKKYKTAKPATKPKKQ